MAKFKLPRTSQYPDYPDNDNDRIDIIFRVFFDKAPNQHHLFTDILSRHLQWTVSPPEIIRLENLIITSGLITPFPQPNANFEMLWLNHEGRRILGDLGSYSAYKYSEVKQSNRGSMNFDDYCNIVLSELEIQSDFVSSILEKHNIVDANLVRGIESHLESQGFIGLTNNGAYIKSAGRAHSTKKKLGGNLSSLPIINYNHIITHGDNSPVGLRDQKIGDIENKTSDNKDDTENQKAGLSISRKTLIWTIISVLIATLIGILTLYHK